MISYLQYVLNFKKCSIFYVCFYILKNPEKPTFIYEFHYDLSTRNGQEHMMLKNPKIESKITKAYFRFDNLFERDQKLGVEINKFLNENWMNVYNDIRPAVEETVSAVITNIVSNFAKKVPFKEVFLS